MQIIKQAMNRKHLGLLQPAEIIIQLQFMVIKYTFMVGMMEILG
jgi:hypothetical protein